MLFLICWISVFRGSVLTKVAGNIHLTPEIRIYQNKINFISHLLRNCSRTMFFDMLTLLNYQVLC